MARMFALIEMGRLDPPVSAVYPFADYAAALDLIASRKAMGKIVLATQAGAVALTRNTFQMVVLASIVPAFLAVIVLAFSAAEVRKAGKRATLPRLTLAAFDTRFKVFLLAVVIFTLGNSSDAFLILRAQERGLSVPGVLGMLATFNLVYALVAGPAGALSDRIGRQRLIVAGWMVYAAVYCGFALANAAWHVWGLYALYGVYYGMFEGVGKAFIADTVPEEQRGTAYGIYNMFTGLTIFPASVLAGVLWQGVGGWAGFGPRAPFFAGALLALVAVAILVLLAERHKASALAR